MPLFNESHDADQFEKKHHHMGYVYSLEDCFSRQIPVTSIEFNPPAVSSLTKQGIDYWLGLETPDAEDEKILKSLAKKQKAMLASRRSGSFMSITDSAAGVLRMFNVSMLRLLEDPAFTQKWLGLPPADWEHQRTILHLTRNHSIRELRLFLKTAHERGFRQLLLITGDPLKEVRLPTISAEEARKLPLEETENYRLKNSIELLHFVQAEAPHFYLGGAHNPFLKREAARKHLLKKKDAGVQFLITQPVSYYDECWRVMGDFEQMMAEDNLKIPIILGVFNYSVPCGPNGYKPDIFEKRRKLWKRLFGFVPEGVREDYDMGLNGIEILARSINKLKRNGYFHFDVMNAESKGYSVVLKGRSFAHELDRLTGDFDRDPDPMPLS